MVSFGLIGMNSKTKNIWGGVAVLVFIGLIAFLVFSRNSTTVNTAAVQNAIQNPTECPTDTLICPNGGVVKRILPNCQFDICPVPENPSPAALYKD